MKVDVESPFASAPVAVASSLAPPVSISACVTVYAFSAVQVMDAPGARPCGGSAGQVTEPSVGSVTATVVRVTSPVFVTW